MPTSFARNKSRVWLVSLIRPLKVNISSRSANLEHRTASVQLALSSQRSRAVLIALGGHMNIRKVGGNVMPIAQVDAGADCDGDIRRNQNRNIARRCFEHRIAALGRRLDELHRDPA